MLFDPQLAQDMGMSSSQVWAGASVAHQRLTAGWCSLLRARVHARSTPAPPVPSLASPHPSFPYCALPQLVLRLEAYGADHCAGQERCPWRGPDGEPLPVARPLYEALNLHDDNQ